MSRATSIDEMIDWARDFKHSRSFATSAFEKAWDELLVELKTGIEALNTEFGEGAFSIFGENGSDFVKIAFGNHELRLLADSRTGEIRYAFASPEMALLDPDQTAVTSKGSIMIDVTSSFPTYRTVPDLKLIPERRPGWAPWTVTNQLAQLLLQMLIAPNYLDDRFQKSSQ